MMTNESIVQMQQAMVASWRKALDEHMARAGALYGRVAELESKAHTQAQGAVDEWARLVKETLTYSHELGHEWRKQSLEAIAQLAPQPAAAPAAETRS